MLLICNVGEFGRAGLNAGNLGSVGLIAISELTRIIDPYLFHNLIQVISGCCLGESSL
jgi:hypothetical protein